MQEVPLRSRPAQPPGSIDAAPSPTTRHLCAGALLDKRFRERILNEVYHRPDRAVAPNHGIDAARVLAHAKAARALEVGRYSLATGIVGIMLLTMLNTPVSFGILVVLVVWAVIGLAVHHAVDYDLFGDINPMQILIVAGAMALMFLIGPIVQSMQSAASSFGGSSGVSESAATGTGLMVLWLIALACSNLYFDVARAGKINELAEFQDRPESDPRIEAIRRLQSTTEVVNYSPYRKPFVGSGTRIATWQFAMPLRPKGNPDEQADPTWPHFDSVQLNDHVRAAVTALAADRGHSRHLPGLQLSDQVYVSGADTAYPAHSLQDLTNMRLPDSFPVIQADPTGPIRHYLRCQAVSWDGELVTTIFIHTAIQGETLYMEFHSYTLAPTSEGYHIFGRNAQTSGNRLGTAAATGLSGVPLAMLTGPIGAVWAIGSAIRNKFAATGRGRGTDDTGALSSIRELGSDQLLHNYFQTRDSVKYTEILEAQLLEAVTAYLGDKVDIEQLTGFTQTIVNNGIVNYGQVQAGAVGKGASASVGAIGHNSRGSAGK